MWCLQPDWSVMLLVYAALMHQGTLHYKQYCCSTLVYETESTQHPVFMWKKIPCYYRNRIKWKIFWILM